MINKINKLAKSEFIKVFGNIFESSSWIAEKLYKLKPFDNFEDLSTKILDIFENTAKEKGCDIIELSQKEQEIMKAKAKELYKKWESKYFPGLINGIQKA